MPRAQAVRVAYEEARRKGYRVPRAPNPLTRRETASALSRARMFRQLARRAAPLARAGYQGVAYGMARAAHDYGQARRPPQPPRWPTLYSPNPPRIVGTVPGEMLTIAYRRTGKYPGRYRHTFEPGVRAYRMSDGSILLRGPLPLWGYR